MQDYAMLANRIGISRFLIHSFINFSGLYLPPISVVKLPHHFPGVGFIAHSRSRCATVPESEYLHSTILQLMNSGEIEMRILDSDPNVQCCLSACDA